MKKGWFSRRGTAPGLSSAQNASASKTTWGELVRMSTYFCDMHQKQLFSPVVWTRQMWALAGQAAVLQTLQSGHKKWPWQGDNTVFSTLLRTAVVKPGQAGVLGQADMSQGFLVGSQVMYFVKIKLDSEVNVLFNIWYEKFNFQSSWQNPFLTKKSIPAWADLCLC